jgi:hypothetical protein
VRTIQTILLLIMCLTFIGCEDSVQQNNAMTGDKLYIPDGYKTQLFTLNLIEVAPLPYFTKPFICVTKDANGQQFGVVFHSTDKVDIVRLPISYEEIIKRVESKGFIVNVSTSSFNNLHMFEINNDLFWNFEDGLGEVWLNINGEFVLNPFKRTH